MNIKSIHQPRVSAIILAAGLSSRMGENKLLKVWEGKTIFQHNLEALPSGLLEEIIVVTGRDSEEIRSIAKEVLPQVKTVHNPDFTSGMTSSIQTGVRAVGDGVSGMMVCLSDMPLLTPEHYEELIYHFGQCYQPGTPCLTAPVVSGKRKNPVIFSRELKDEILAHGEKEGCREIVAAHSANLHTVEFTDERPFTDIDTLADFSGLENND